MIQIQPKSSISKTKSLSTYISLRPVQLILVDDDIADPDSHFNSLNILPDSGRNIVACSMGLQKHITNLQTNHYNKTIDDMQFDELLEDIDLTMLEENITEDPKESSCESMASSDESNNDIGENLIVPKRVKSNFVIDDKSKTPAEWEECIKSLKTICHDYSKSILFKSIVDFFLDIAELKNIIEPTVKSWHTSPLFVSFINYLVEHEENLEISQPALNRYLTFCVRKSDFDMLKFVYNRIKGRVPVYNSTFLITLIKGLSFDGRLEEAKQLLKMLFLFEDKKLLYRHNGLTIFCIGCFKNNDPITAINIMQLLMQESGIASPSLVEPFLNYFSYSDNAVKWKENYETVLSFFNWLYANDISLTSEGAQHIARWFENIKSENWTSATFPSYRIRRGLCPITQHKMKECKLSQNEFNYLEKSISRLLLQRSVEDVSLEHFNQDLTSTSNASFELFHQTSLKDMRAFFGISLC